MHAAGGMDCLSDQSFQSDGPEDKSDAPIPRRLSWAAQAGLDEQVQAQERTERRILLDRVNQLQELLERNLGACTGLAQLRRTLEEVEGRSAYMEAELAELRTSLAATKVESSQRLDALEAHSSRVSVQSEKEDNVKLQEEVQMQFEERLGELHELMSSTSDVFQTHARALQALKAAHAEVVATGARREDQQAALLVRIESAEDELALFSSNDSRQLAGQHTLAELRNRIERLESLRHPEPSERLESLEKAVGYLAGQRSKELDAFREVQAEFRLQVGDLSMKVEALGLGESIFGNSSMSEELPSTSESMGLRKSLALQARKSGLPARKSVASAGSTPVRQTFSR